MFRRAPSKINLYLRVCGKLPNGYHEIETLFLPLNDPADELEISFRDDERGEITVDSDAALPTGRDNLCGKAAEAVCAALGIRPSITVFIRKHTPVAAGMGGGSFGILRIEKSALFMFNTFIPIQRKTLARRL